MKGWLDNYNDSKVSTPPGFVGQGTVSKGFDYNSAWGGQWEDGGQMNFLQPTSSKLPKGYSPPLNIPSTERAMSIGGEDGEPSYLIPSFKYGAPLKDPIDEFRKTKDYLGGPFKTWQEADKWEQEVRHPYVEKGQDIPTPLRRWGKEFQGGGSLIDKAPMIARPKIDNVELNTDAIPQWVIPTLHVEKLPMGYDYHNGINLGKMYYGHSAPTIKAMVANGAKTVGTLGQVAGGLLNIAIEEKDIANSSYPERTREDLERQKRKAIKVFKREDTYPNPWLEDGGNMKYYQEGLDFKPKSISKEGSELPKFQPGGMLFVPPKQQEQVASQTLGLLGEFMSIPQKAMVYGISGNYETPSKALGMDDSYGAMIFDAVTDPTMYIAPEMLLNKGRFLKRGIRELGQAAKDMTYKIRNVGSEEKAVNVMKDVYQSLDNPESIRRMEDLGIDAEKFLKKQPNVTSAPGGSSYWGFADNVNINMDQIKSLKKAGYDLGLPEIMEHELAHRMQGHPSVYNQPDPSGLPVINRTDIDINPLNIDERLNELPLITKDKLREDFEKASKLSDKRAINSVYQDVDYFMNAGRDFDDEMMTIERFPHLMETKRSMMSKGLLKDRAQEITPEMLRQFGEMHGPRSRVMSFLDKSNPESYNILAKYMNKLPVAAGVAAGVASQKQRNGGITKDDMGYWNPDNWGKPVEIGSNEITMQGVNQPLLGISDKGDKKVMLPGKDYKFKGKKVQEFPISKDGNQLTKLDQLTNFTNYNKPTRGGWLDKYK